ncbi:MAG: hypothetical protein ACRDJ9_34340, partial [Dehalococcoidia bacterium]
MARGPGLDAVSGTLAAELERRERELAALSAIAGLAGAAVNPIAAFGDVAAYLEHLLPPGPFAAAVLGDDDLTLAPLRPYADALRLRPPAYAGTPLDTSLRERRTVHGRASAQLHPAFPEIAAWLAVPLLSG